VEINLTGESRGGEAKGCRGSEGRVGEVGEVRGSGGRRSWW